MKNKGQMLIEIVVAIGVLALVLVGVSDLMTRSARLLSYQKDREAAYSVARELLNQYRKDRDTNPTTFFGTVSGFSRDVCYVGSKYGCKTEVTSVVGGVAIGIRVYWFDGPTKYEIKLDQVLSEI